MPHVVRPCASCGRELHIVPPGEHGKGIKVEKGDRFVIPSGWLNLTPHPLKGTGRFTRSGIGWWAQHVFVSGLMSKAETFATELAALEKHADNILYESPLIQPLDVNDAEEVKQIHALLKDKSDSREFWAYWMGQFCAGAREAISSNDAEGAAWSIACAERCRAMLIFKDEVEEVVWMGNSARRLIDALRIWDTSKGQADEQFWQLTFNEHSYVLSQVFAVPVVFIGEKAYVGGMTVDRRDAKFVDYLFSAESSRESILVEIKAPTTKLLGGKYRGLYSPSADLSGAVVQVLSYRADLLRHLTSLVSGTPIQLAAFRPRCILVVGDASAQLTSPQRREAFELFRASSDVEIITYDELFRKVEILAQLFGLTRKSAT